MKRTGPPKRRSGVKPVNRKRKKRRRDAGEVYGPYYVLVANLPTCVGQRGWVLHRCVYYEHRKPEAHHVKTVGAGGKDRANLVDVCHAFHDHVHDTPRSQVEAELGFGLEDEARAVARRLIPAERSETK